MQRFHRPLNPSYKECSKQFKARWRCNVVGFKHVLAMGLLTAACLHTAAAQDPVSTVIRMAANEKAARVTRNHFIFLSKEKSTRTNNQLWTERVVETDDGPLRRLLRIDGRPLTPDESSAEDRRLQAIANNPDDFRRLNESSKDDEAHLLGLLSNLPTAFVLTPAGRDDDCTRFTFKPNPSFQPSGMEQRVIHVMEGTVSLKEPEDRLCLLQARIAQPVAFGFGIFGRINEGGNFTVERHLVNDHDWKTLHMAVHLDGKILMMKTLARDQETQRSDVRVVPLHIPLQQAVDLSKQ